MLAVHGSPRSDTDYIYPSLTAEALRQKLEGVGTQPALLACGHSHVPFAARVGGVSVVNCGSVGRPADGDPRGSFALADISDGNLPKINIVRFAYPMRELEQALLSRRVPGISMSEYEMGIKL
jgi:predicted phosphodiesterase